MRRAARERRRAARRGNPAYSRAFLLAELGDWIESAAYKQALGRDGTADAREAARIEGELLGAGVVSQADVDAAYDAAVTLGRTRAARAARR